MLTAELLQKAFKDIVSKLRPDVSFHLETNKILDRTATDVVYPVACWMLPETGLVENETVLQDTYTISMLFLDQTASDRSRDERDGTHARMEAIAKAVVRRFHSKYIKDQGSFDGHPLDLVIQGSPRFQPIWDESTDMRTGVALHMTVRDVGVIECEDIYFDA